MNEHIERLQATVEAAANPNMETLMLEATLGQLTQTEKEVVELRTRLAELEAAARAVVDSAKDSSDGRYGRVPDCEIDRLEAVLNKQAPSAAPEKND